MRAMTESIEPFELHIPDADLEDLQRRLAATRWPDAATVPDWSQGVPLPALRALVAHWQHGYDWRRCEARLNALGQYRTRIDGLGIHFLHVKSRHPNALPLLLTHGWPGSVVEFLKVIGPLVDPLAHGGAEADAFHIVIPTLPGFGFSDKPQGTGWSVERIAAAWVTLMQRLGYQRYVAQGGDWGSAITCAMGALRPPGLAAIHLNMVSVPPPQEAINDAQSQEALAVAKRHQRYETGYARQQATRPQTLGYALADSPVGQAAWIYEKFQCWTDCGGDPESVLSRDEMLDNIMLYWLPDAAASSARLYWESWRGKPHAVDIPVAVSLFPRELSRPPRHWAQKYFSQIVYWNKVERGGHFAAFEQPALFVRELRDAFRFLRIKA